MTLGTIALAVTLGSIIGMTCIMVREYRLRVEAERKSRYLERVRVDYMRELLWAQQKLSRNNPRDARGRFTKKGGA